MRSKLDLAAHIVLGLIYFVFGLNGFLQFIPLPELPPKAGAFLGGLAESGYFFPVLKATEVICGLLLLVRRFVPLSLVVLAPISIQIFLFHLFLTPTPTEWIMPIVILAIHAYLGFVVYKNSFRGVLAATP